MLPFGAIYDPGYKIFLFLHIIAVVVALGPTFGYGIFFSVLPKYPRSAPALIAGMRKIDRLLVNPGMILLLIAGIVLLATSSSVWKGSQFFVVWGFIAIIALSASSTASLDRRWTACRSSPRKTSRPVTPSAPSSKQRARKSPRSGPPPAS